MSYGGRRRFALKAYAVPKLRIRVKEVDFIKFGVKQSDSVGFSWSRFRQCNQNGMQPALKRDFALVLRKRGLRQLSANHRAGGSFFIRVFRAVKYNRELLRRAGHCLPY